MVQKRLLLIAGIISLAVLTGFIIFRIIASLPRDTSLMHDDTYRPTLTEIQQKSETTLSSSGCEIAHAHGDLWLSCVMRTVRDENTMQRCMDLPLTVPIVNGDGQAVSKETLCWRAFAKNTKNAGPCLIDPTDATCQQDVVKLFTIDDIKSLCRHTSDAAYQACLDGFVQSSVGESAKITQVCTSIDPLLLNFVAFSSLKAQCEAL